MGTRWRGLLAPIDTATGDGRRFLQFTNRDLPLPHRWQRQDTQGHDDSVIVGLTDEVAVLTVQEAITQGFISEERAAAAKLPQAMQGFWGKGDFFDDIDAMRMPRLAEDVAEAMHLSGVGVLGPSVGAGEVEFFGWVHPGTNRLITEDDMVAADLAGRQLQAEALFSAYEVAESTMVPVPAFSETSTPFEILTDTAVVAALTAASGMPIADRGHSWDGAAAAGRVFAMATNGDKVDTAAVAKAFLWKDPDADPQTKAAYKLGYCDVIDGKLQIVPAGVAACAGGRGVDAAKIPDDAKTRIKSRVCGLYNQIRNKYDDWPDCPFARTKAALTAAGVYPAEWFEDPQLSQVTPIVVTDEGRVFGHAAQWEVCHTGIREVCVLAPQSVTDYALLHRYPIDTTNGLVAAGRLTTGHGNVGTGCTHVECRGKDDHACESLSLTQAIDHYDRLKTLAWFRTGVDEHGIWFAGAVATTLDADDRKVLSRRMVSGDWRPVGVGDEMIEVMALSKAMPGFPLRAKTTGRRTASLTAAGFVHPDLDAPPVSQDEFARLVANHVVAELRPTAVTAADPQPADDEPAVDEPADEQPADDPPPDDNADVDPDEVADLMREIEESMLLADPDVRARAKELEALNRELEEAHV